MSTISNFVNTVIAIIKGDDAEVIGLKYKKELFAVLTAQIAVKVCRTLSLEGIEDAEDNLNKARVNNGTLIVNDDQYIQKLLDAKFKFDQAASDLSDHKQDIEFLKKELENAKK
jgi:hypothetical protein